MTSSEIQIHLIRWAQSGSGDIVVPNYYIGRYECDLVKISRSNYLTEYEIKISRADFKKDAEKSQRNWRDNNVISTKHDDIRTGKRCNRFYFVVPEGLVTNEEVPAGFGLINACACPYGSERIEFKIVKMSKLFPGKHCNEDRYKHIAGNLVFKLEAAKRRAYKAEKSYRELLKSKSEK